MIVVSKYAFHRTTKSLLNLGLYIGMLLLLIPYTYSKAVTGNVLCMYRG